MAWSNETKRALRKYGRGRSSQIRREEDRIARKEAADKKWDWLKGGAQMGASGAMAGGAIGGAPGALIGLGAGFAGGALLGSQEGGADAVGAIAPAVGTAGAALAPRDRILQQYDARQQQRAPAGQGMDWADAEMDDVLSPEEQKRRGYFNWS